MMTPHGSTTPVLSLTGLTGSIKQKGLAPFVLASTAVVTLSVTQPDTNYVVLISPEVSGSFYINGATKTTTQFTITSSSGPVTGNVGWAILER